MTKICRNCKQSFDFINLEEEGDTPDTVFCPHCAEAFKYERMIWDRRLKTFEDTDIIPMILREERERTIVKIPANESAAGGYHSGEQL